MPPSPHSIRGPAYAMGTVMIAASGLVFTIVRGFGFPDGHMTDLERAYAHWCEILLIPAVFIGLNFWVLGHRAPRSNVRTWFWISVVASLVLALAAATIWIELRGRLEDGGGG